MQFGLAAAIEPLFIANWLAGDALFAWRVVSTDGKPVRASNGALSPVDGDLSQAEDRDSVFVLASFEPSQAARNPQVIRWLKRMARKGTELGGIENGSQALAEAGLLDRHTVAIHWDNLAGFQELYAKVTAVAQLYAFSGNRISCAGGSAILDMMVAWISRHTTPTPSWRAKSRSTCCSIGFAPRTASSGPPSRSPPPTRILWSVAHRV